MAKVKLEGDLKISDLSIGKIFADLELIIDFDGMTMTTLTHEEGEEVKGDHYQEYDMRVYRYNFEIGNDGKVRNINCNGWGEIFLSDENHDEDKSKLVEAGIWGKK